MKKTLLLLLVTGVAAGEVRLQAQGTVFLNNYDSRAGIYYGGPPAPAGITFVEILGGPSPATWAPLLNASGQGPVFTIEAAGVEALGKGTGSYFDVGYAFVPGVSPGSSAFFALRSWVGAASWDTAVDRATVVWSQMLGTADKPTQLMIPGGLDLFTPEPSPAALVGLALAVFGFRRFHQRPR